MAKPISKAPARRRRWRGGGGEREEIYGCVRARGASKEEIILAAARVCAGSARYPLIRTHTYIDSRERAHQ